MAQKMMLLEGAYNKDILTHEPIANLLAEGYTVSVVSGFMNQGTPMCYILLNPPTPEEGGGEGGGEGGDGLVAAPTFVPDTEDFITNIGSVEIKCDTEGATIYYQKEGGDENVMTKYEGTITITEETVLKAVAVKGGVMSEFKTHRYTVNPNIPVE